MERFVNVGYACQFMQSNPRPDLEVIKHIEAGIDITRGLFLASDLPQEKFAHYTKYYRKLLEAREEWIVTGTVKTANATY